MSMDETGGARRQSIATALAAELERQGIGQVDVQALADAVERGMEQKPPEAEGKRPEDLNATNDD